MQIAPKEVKERNQSWLASKGIKVPEHLPELEPPTELAPRPARLLAGRAWVLSHVIGIGYGQPGKRMLEEIRRKRLEEFLTPDEHVHLERVSYTERQLWRARWFAEAVFALAFSLKIYDLDPLKGCPDDLARQFAPNADPWRMIDEAQLRDYTEIYSAADLHYRLHWASRQASLEGKEFLVSEILVENRRHALDFAIGLPFEWDEIPLDT